MGTPTNISEIIRKKIADEDYKAAAEEAKAYLESTGLTKMPQGSYLLWMHIEWLNKGLADGAIAENKDSGAFLPVVRVLKTENPVGRRGKKTIFETVEALDMTAFKSFAERYNKYLYAREKEDEEIKTLAYT